MLTPAIALIAFALCCYGWGRTAYTIFYFPRAPLHAFSVALGLVVLVFIGGILNTAALAGATSLAFCTYAGIGLGALFLLQTGRTIDWRLIFSGATVPFWLCTILVGGLGLFLIRELLPSHVFDYSDDVFSYLVRPVRMLTTGTLGGNPFELLGQSDFGAQSFLQGMLLIWLPLDDAYAFDTIFCFLLGLCLLFEAGRAKAVPPTLLALAVAVYLAINPQIVNISSVYSTAALILALLTAATILLEVWDQEAPPARLAAYAIPVSAIAATLTAIKLTSALFVVPFFVVAFVVLLARRPRAAAMLALAIVASGAIFLAGWLIPHLDKFIVSSWSSPARFLNDPSLIVWPSLLEGFRDRPTLYGGTRAMYVVGLVPLAISLAVSATRLYRRTQTPADLVIIAAMMGGMVCYFGLPVFVNNEAALRYTVPFLIALVPWTLFDALPAGHQGRRHVAQFLRSGPALWIAAVQVIFLIAFFGVDQVRLARIVNEHTVTSIPISEQNRAYQARMLSPEGRNLMRSAQGKVPAGATIWAWVDAPFALDFARNRVWTYNIDWAVAPWRLNARTAEDLRSALRSRGVHYILWQYNSGFIANVATMRGYLQTVQWPEYRIILGSAIELQLSLEALATPSPPPSGKTTRWKSSRSTPDDARLAAAKLLGSAPRCASSLPPSAA